MKKIANFALVATLISFTLLNFAEAKSSLTAKSKDGTYSYSQHRRGTCSHHKGVKTWYK